MEQQYMTELLDAYRRGYKIRYKGKEGAPERKEHYFKMKGWRCSTIAQW
ncbi:MAG: hypothetical protein IJX41_06515 [Bacteroidaceae bacterium]|nr:hypothetical protein [Bacteroidaceae bacterium]